MTWRPCASSRVRVHLIELRGDAGPRGPRARLRRRGERRQRLAQTRAPRAAGRGLDGGRPGQRQRHVRRQPARGRSRAAPRARKLRFGAVSFRVEIEGDDIEATVVAAPPPDATVSPRLSSWSTPPLGVPTARPGASASSPPTPHGSSAPSAGAPPPREGGTSARPATCSGSAPLRAGPAARGRASACPCPQCRRGPGPFRPARAPAARRSGGPDAGAARLRPRRAKSPFFWMVTGCCGCLLLGVLLGGGHRRRGLLRDPGPRPRPSRRSSAELRQGDLEAAYGRLSRDLQARLPARSSSSLVQRPPGPEGQQGRDLLEAAASNNDQATSLGRPHPRPGRRRAGDLRARQGGGRLGGDRDPGGRDASEDPSAVSTARPTPSRSRCATRRARAVWSSPGTTATSPPSPSTTCGAGAPARAARATRRWRATST